MEVRKVIEFGDLTKREKEEVVEEMAEELIRPIVLEAIDLHENTTLYLKNEIADELVSSLKAWGEHRNFDNEFSLEEIPNQYWYHLCNGVLYLNDMVKAIHKVIGIIQHYNVDLRDSKLFLKVIEFIKEDSDFLYSEMKKEFN